MSRLTDMLVEWARQKRRWPLLLLLPIPAAFTLAKLEVPDQRSLSYLVPNPSRPGGPAAIVLVDELGFLRGRPDRVSA